MAEENSNKRIARNTMLLYTRSLVNLVIGLYTSRLTLDALGIPDYGIYNVVGSLVALFGLFNGSLNTAISRFITYGVPVPGFAATYMEALWEHEWLQAWIAAAEAEDWVIEQFEVPDTA